MTTIVQILPNMEYGEKTPVSTIKTSAERTKTLSAVESRNLPKSVMRLYFLAM